MSQTVTPTADLEQLGWTAARQVAGQDAVEQVEVKGGVDAFDRPAYHYSFLIDPHRAQLRPGLVVARVTQALLAELLARGDEHRPIIRLLDRTDWDRHTRAQSH
jgi:hypothetical protein